jgi:D-glycero-D-manno-heptose 1,7-bisphosphate phosphatase
VKAVLLDRDGVINALVYHSEAGVIDTPFTLSQFELLPGVPEAIRQLNDLGLAVAVVSNQPGIAKGRFTADLLESFDQRMLSEVAAVGGRIDRIYYCLHHPDAVVAEWKQRCRCRKPEIGLLEQAARELNVALSDCYMVGDGIPDLVAGVTAGCRTVFVGRWKCEICQFTEAPSVCPAFTAKSLLEVSEKIRLEMDGINCTPSGSARGRNCQDSITPAFPPSSGRN